MGGETGDDIYFVDNRANRQGSAPPGPTTGCTPLRPIRWPTMSRDSVFGDGLRGTGNNIANTIYGDGAFAKTLYGKDGDDYIVGGAGNEPSAAATTTTNFGQAASTTSAAMPVTITWSARPATTR